MQVHQMEQKFHKFQDSIIKAIAYETWLANPDALPLTETKIKTYLSRFQLVVSQNSQQLLALLQDELMELCAQLSYTDEQG